MKAPSVPDTERYNLAPLQEERKRDQCKKRIEMADAIGRRRAQRIISVRLDDPWTAGQKRNRPLRHTKLTLQSSPTRPPHIALMSSNAIHKQRATKDFKLRTPILLFRDCVLRESLPTHTWTRVSWTLLSGRSETLKKTTVAEPTGARQVRVPSGTHPNGQL